MSTLRVLGISGSLRRLSCNTGLLRAAQEAAPPSIEVEIAHIGDLPLFNEDVAPHLPPSVERLRAQIKDADAILISTPEYNHSVSSPLKNAIDWASWHHKRMGIPPSPLHGIHVGVMGVAGDLGSERAQGHLRQMMAYFENPVMESPQLCVRRWDKEAWPVFDETGNLVSSRELMKLSVYMEEFEKFVRQTAVQSPEQGSA
eukprot:GFYU01014812.1.p1 GENE.GFYU01014812.1~~GFYU01014812.1.p1  ORF type:complete len:201 (-),score=32.82 GFYU01014812.1:113-715(-)